MSIKLMSGDSANLASVTDDGELKVRLTDEAETAGFVRVAGALYGGDEGEELRVGEDGHLFVAQESMLFYDQVEGSALNTLLWGSSASNMTVTQAAGAINLNAGAAVTAGAYASISSLKHMPLYGQYPIEVCFSVATNVAAQPNSTIEFGIGLVATNAAPTDGVFVRFAADGSALGVINYGGVESTFPLTFDPEDNPYSVNQMNHWVLVIDNDDVHIMMNSDLVGEAGIPAANPFVTSNGRLPVFARVYNAGSAPAVAPRLFVGRVMVVQAVLNQERLWGTTLASMGRGAYQSPVTPFAQTANHANSTSPGSATLANTTAGYTTLGGRFQFIAPAGAGTDFALFAYQVPTGYQLFVSGIAISTVNTGAAVATTPTLLDWSLGINASAVSLATTDGASTWAPRRMPLGMQSFLVGAAIGQQAETIDRDFDSPIVVDSGRYLHIILQVPVGTATASQIIRGDVWINGFFE